MDHIIRTEGVTKSYRSGGDTIYALKDVSICVPSKSLTVLKGRSGSGKTTLLNLIGALERPDKGMIFLKSIELTYMTDSVRDRLRRKDIGYIFQSVALMPSMSAYENVEFTLRISGYDRKKRSERAKTCLSMLGMQSRMHHKPSELSGGEQQRVAIARAMAHEPLLILADEPTAELDTHLGLQVVRIFKELVETQKISVLMTTHDPNMAEVADHVFSLEDGEIIDDK